MKKVVILFALFSIVLVGCNCKTKHCTTQDQVADSAAMVVDSATVAEITDTTVVD